ncbi:hypothetical protein [Virgisporangium aliadipatigenens]|nr:hypothetical protein [Virgisporangium aliadipatigenens]
MTRWWSVVVAGAAVTLLFVWLGRLAGVPAQTLISVGAALAALMWAAVLVTVPWNLYFAARGVVAGMARSRERGIDVLAKDEDEARVIARRMLGFAIAAHMVSAGVTAVAAHIAGEVVGLYVAGLFLLSTAARPSGAYFAHLRERITTLGRDSTFPHDDVVSLRAQVHGLQTQLQSLEAAREADEDAARRRAEEVAQLRRSIDRMTRRFEDTVDGMSNHQELITGLRALVRMIRSEPV